MKKIKRKAGVRMNEKDKTAIELILTIIFNMMNQIAITERKGS